MNKNKDELERYSRQVIFEKIGRQGQSNICRSRVLVVGVGALGSISSEMLTRAGVGFLRLVDRDHLELTNLQRQSLYDEEDLERCLPKAVAAAEKLRRINSKVVIEALAEDVVPDNVSELIDDVQLIIDGTDNFETRYLLNDACVSAGKTWIYAACVGSYGMSFVIQPGKSACLRCFLEDEPPPGTTPTCETAGIIAPIAHVVVSYQITEALKILAGRGEDLLGSVLSMDVWKGTFDRFQLSEPRTSCPACGRRQFDYLHGKRGSRTESLCGRNAVQVYPIHSDRPPLNEIADRLRPLGEVKASAYLVKFKVDDKELVIFADGRAIVHGTDNPSTARSLYARYVGI